jgi:hypothetical protein
MELITAAKSVILQNPVETGEQKKDEKKFYFLPKGLKNILKLYLGPWVVFVTYKWAQ